MKLNQNSQILGSKIRLVPYEAKHVPRYHDWMKSEELQILTASDPLSLEEEYKMQQTWREDEDKCTFIVLSGECEDDIKQSEIDSMVGDVNLFFNNPDDRTTAEVEIMIAEVWARGKGYGKEALCSMMKYSTEELKVKKFTAKIGYSNQSSLNLFSKLGFKEVSRSDVFQEVTLELLVTDYVRRVLDSLTPKYRIISYCND